MRSTPEPRRAPRARWWLVSGRPGAVSLASARAICRWKRWAPRASAKPAAPEVPVVILDDVPPKSAVSPEALARWFVAPGTPPAAEALLTPLPLAPATTIAGRPGQDPKAGIKPLEGDARPARKPRDSNAQMPGKRRTANARACGSQSRFSDLLRRLNLASRCPTRRSAA